MKLLNQSFQWESKDWSLTLTCDSIKSPPSLVGMLVLEPLVLEDRWRAMKTLWRQTVWRCWFLTGEFLLLLLFDLIVTELRSDSRVSLQHRSMASVRALLMFLPVAWTCSPQKAGNIRAQLLLMFSPCTSLDHYTVRFEERKRRGCKNVRPFLTFVSFQTTSWCRVFPTPSSPTFQSVLTAGRSTSCPWEESATLGFTARDTTASSSQTWRPKTTRTAARSLRWGGEQVVRCEGGGGFLCSPVLISALHSTCQAKTPSTFSITPLCPTTRRWRSETSRSTTPSAACTERRTWSTTPSSAKGKHPRRTRRPRWFCVDNLCILTQWLAAFLLNRLLFPEWLRFMSTTGV